MKYIYTLVLIVCSHLIIAQTTINGENPLEEMGLSELAETIRPGFLVGTHLHPPLLNNNMKMPAKAQAILEKHYNYVSLGIYQKAMQRNGPEDWEFTKNDAFMDFAKANDMVTYGHPILGSDGYIPDWFLNGTFTDAEIWDILETRVKTIVERYRNRATSDQMQIIDIYNEGLGRGLGANGADWKTTGNAANFLLTRFGYRTSASGIKVPVVLDSLLRWTREYSDPCVKLVYNDNYNTMDNLPQSDKCIEMVKGLRELGTPIDGIGMQCHMALKENGDVRCGASATNTSPIWTEEGFVRNMQKFEAENINVYISEMDVAIHGDDFSDLRLEQQAEVYVAFLRSALNSPNCKGFKTWGFTDNYAFTPDANNPDPLPLIFDKNYDPKPAFTAMMDYLKTRAASVIDLPKMKFNETSLAGPFIAGDFMTVQVVPEDDNELDQINSVALYFDNQLIRIDEDAPFAWGGASSHALLSNLTAGCHALRVVTTYHNTTETTSLFTEILVEEGSGNQNPEITFISPSSNQVFEFGEVKKVEGIASDPDGTITSVELYINDEYIATKTDAFIWYNNGKMRDLDVGFHTIKLVATDNEGATSEAEIVIEVIEPLITGIRVVATQSMEVYPNPASNKITIKGIEKDQKWEVTNTIGVSTLIGQGTSVDISSLPKGTYILQAGNQVVRFFK